VKTYAASCIRCRSILASDKAWLLLLGMNGKEIGGYNRWTICPSCNHKLRNWLTTEEEKK